MGPTLAQFAAECHRILKANPGPTGRQQVCTRLQEVLKDESFLQGSELRVIQRELELEGAIGHAAPLAHEGDNLIHNRDKVHTVSSLPGAVPVYACGTPS